MLYANLRGKKMPILYVAFKGNGNSANKTVKNLDGDKLFLTNSYSGLKKDIDNINNNYDLVYMFGLDKTLKGNIRIESTAQKNDVLLYSQVDFYSIAANLNQNGIKTHIENAPKQSLCNEAYWYMLKKFNCRVLFLHIPSVKYITEDFIKKIKATLSAYTKINF